MKKRVAITRDEFHSTMINKFYTDEEIPDIYSYFVCLLGLFCAEEYLVIEGIP